MSNSQLIIMAITIVIIDPLLPEWATIKFKPCANPALIDLNGDDNDDEEEEKCLFVLLQ